MKPKTRTRFLPRIIAVAVGAIMITCMLPSSVHAFALNLYRDFLSYDTAAQVSVNNAQSNYDICAPVAVSVTALPWLQTALADVAESQANYGFLDQFSYYGSAYYSYFKYLGYNNPSNLLAYLELGQDYAEAYHEQAEIYSGYFSDAGNAAYTAYGEAINANAPEDPSQFDSYYEGVITADYDSWIALYGTWWSGNDYYYATSLADYGYNVWSFYGAPNYATSWYLGQLGSAYGAMQSNAIQAGQYQVSKDYFPESVPGEAYEAIVEYYADYYDPITEYYYAYASYYRDISEFTEG